MTNQGLSGFADGLKRLVSLKELELNFGKSDFHLEKYLFIQFRCPKVADKGLVFLARGLKHLTSLKKLNVDFML